MLMYIFFYLLYSPAEAFFKHAVEIKENALGRDHPSLVKVISLSLDSWVCDLQRRR